MPIADSSKETDKQKITSSSKEKQTKKKIT